MYGNGTWISTIQNFTLTATTHITPRSFGTPQVGTKYAVIRGESWYQSNNQLRSENRNFANAKASLSHLGFGV